MKLAFAAALMLAALSACNSASPEDSSPEEGAVQAEPAQPSQDTFEAGSNGASATVASGQIFMVKLETIPTAGYVWQVAEKPDFLTQVDENTVPTNPELQNQPGFTGGNHYMIFAFEVTGSGSGTLKLVEGRPWELEAGNPPDNTWSIQIDAPPAP